MMKTIGWTKTDLRNGGDDDSLLARLKKPGGEPGDPEPDDTQNSTVNSEIYMAIDDIGFDAIVIADRFGQVKSFNSAAQTIFGYSSDDIIGRNLDFLIPDTNQAAPGAHRYYLEGDPVSGELRITGRSREVAGLRKDGSTVTLDLSIVEGWGRNGLRCFTCVMRDVTERNVQAREWRLATELANHATEIAQQARSGAEAANRAKTDFLAVMSHEIRTPMTSISGFVDLLANTGGLTPQQRRYVELVRTANAALLTIVNDILDFSKVEAGQLDLECHPFSSSYLIQDAVGIVRPLASAKNLSIEYKIDRGVPAWLVGDPSRLRQVLLNLLNNAIKFTEEGAITVDVRPQIMSDGRKRIRFSVTDTGIGIPAEQQYRLFKAFSQADSSVSRQHGGTGLGLAICKHLIELMGGDIGVISDVAQGASVWFGVSLPSATQPGADATAERAPEVVERKRARILVVDDIVANLEIVEAYLVDNGYSVDTIGSAAEAIEMLQNERYDLVLMDIQMSLMDGVTATRRIRALPHAIKDIPIIAMTGDVLPQQVRGFLDAGMNDHIAKPIERAMLYKNVQRWLPRTSGPEVNVALGSSHFDKGRYDQLVRELGISHVESIATQYLDQLNVAFKCTGRDARAEAHDLLNCAGLLGFVGLADACLALNQSIPDDVEPERAKLDEARRAQSIARHTLVNRLLPDLQGALFSASARGDLIENRQRLTRSTRFSDAGALCFEPLCRTFARRRRLRGHARHDNAAVEGARSGATTKEAAIRLKGSIRGG